MKIRPHLRPVMWENCCMITALVLWFGATAVGNFQVPVTSIGSDSTPVVRTHQTKKPSMTVGKGGTDCLFTLTTNCLSASLMFVKLAERGDREGQSGQR